MNDGKSDAERLEAQLQAVRRLEAELLAVIWDAGYDVAGRSRMIDNPYPRETPEWWAFVKGAQARIKKGMTGKSFPNPFRTENER